MGLEKQLFFPPFTLDISNERLLHGSEQIPLRPKSFAILRYLVEHPHRLVTKAELLSAVWPHIRVVEGALKVSILEIRKALGDIASDSKYIRTEGRKGYRFSAPISLTVPEKAGSDSFVHFVGRDAELGRLRNYIELANSGRRQVVFITGEPGIGKTTIVEAFINYLSKFHDVVTAQGQCIEQYGAGEAYMPILDALQRMCEGPSGERTSCLIRRYAPSWLVNLPGVASLEERAELERGSVGVSPERRLREIAGFLEAMAREKTVLLVLEDLHWLDPSTLALISFLARRPEAARLLLIGTYRQGEVENLNHPLKAVKEELGLHHHCNHMPLHLLSRAAVRQYLNARFNTSFVSDELASAVYKRSEGNPLFMVNVTDYLIARQAIVQESDSVGLRNCVEEEIAPSSIRQLIERQLETLPAEDQQLLEGASVAGMSFSAAVVAAALQKPVEEIENHCQRLVEREQFLEPSGVSRWPDGNIASRYGFIHALYQNVIYDRMRGSRKARLHQRIGERLEAGHTGASDEVAAELALHFERAGDNDRAVEYLLQAAQRATRQSAYEEAVNYSKSALALLQNIPPSSRRNDLELSLETLLGVSLTASEGYASANTKQAFTRAQALSRNVNNKPLLFQTLAGHWSFFLIAGELHSALQLSREMLALATQTKDPTLLLNAHMAAGLALFYSGQLSDAHKHLERLRAYSCRENPTSSGSAYGWDPEIVVACYQAMTLWFLGCPAKDRETTSRAFSRAQHLDNAFHSAIAHGLLATYHGYRGDPNNVLFLTESTIQLSTENGFSHWLALATLLKGWALSKKGKNR